MKMGSPELPNDENITRPAVNNLPMHGASDDSDNENIDEDYAGYQPLAIDEDTTEQQNNESAENDDDEDDNYDYSAFNAPTHAPETGINVPTIDAEVESEVWNAPRPESTNIVLDSTTTEQIMTVMANISIPTTSIPTWAQGVSEDKWKEDLLQRIRQRHNPSNQ